MALPTLPAERLPPDLEMSWPNFLVPVLCSASLMGACWAVGHFQLSFLWIGLFTLLYVVIIKQTRSFWPKIRFFRPNLNSNFRFSSALDSFLVILLVSFWTLGTFFTVFLGHFWIKKRLSAVRYNLAIPLLFSWKLRNFSALSELIDLLRLSRLFPFLFSSHVTIGEVRFTVFPLI